MSSSTTSGARTPALATNRRARWLLPLLLVVLVALTWHRLVRPPGQDEPALSGRALGTTWSVRLGRAEPDDDLRAAIEACLDEVDRAMSTYREDSELSRFNRHASREPFAVSAPVLEVFRVAGEVSERSGGALDVTVGPLVALWGFGAGARIPAPPTREQLEETRERVGWQRVVLDEAAGTLSKTHPEVVCDLSAVAKGHAVDRVAALLAGRGARDFLVDVGGELRARGSRPDGGPWRVGIETPDATGRRVLEIVELRDESLATSGDYRNFWDDDGVRRSHLIDPRTGVPIEHGTASVSVIHADVAHADAWATALGVLGHVEGREVAEREGLAVHFVVREAGGGFTTRATDRFAAHVRSDP